MRLRLQIFSAAFIAIFALLQVEPLFQKLVVAIEENNDCSITTEQACKKQVMSFCSKGVCPMPVEDAEEKGECKNTGCNPFVPCSIGICCYLPEGFYSYSKFELVIRQKLVVFNDNRISRGLSECWHPPELIS